MKHILLLMIIAPFFGNGQVGDSALLNTLKRDVVSYDSVWQSYIKSDIDANSVVTFHRDSIKVDWVILENKVGLLYRSYPSIIVREYKTRSFGLVSRFNLLENKYFIKGKQVKLLAFKYFNGGIYVNDSVF